MTQSQSEEKSFKAARSRRVKTYEILGKISTAFNGEDKQLSKEASDIGRQFPQRDVTYTIPRDRHARDLSRRIVSLIR